MKKFLKLILIIVAVLLLSQNVNKVEAKNMEFLYLSEVAVGENVYVQENKEINSDVISLGGDIFVKGKVQGGVMAIGGNVYIDGKVFGNATSIGGKVFIGNKGTLEGKKSEIVNNIKPPTINQVIQKIYSIKFTTMNKIIMFLVVYLASIIIYKCMTNNVMKMVYNFESNLINSFKYGYIVTLIIPFIIIALMLTILGTILIPLILVILFMLCMIGFTVFNIYIGEKLLKNLNGNIPSIVYIALGLGIYSLIINFIFCYVDKFIFLAVFLFILVPFNIGIVMSSKFGTFQPWKKDNIVKWDWYKEK